MTISAAAIIFTLVQILSVVSVVFAVLYIVFSCRRYHESVSVGLCILAVFLPLIAVLIQFSRSRHYQGAGMNVCRQCGEKVPPTYEVCPRCLVPLEPYDEAGEKKSKSLADIMFGVFAVSKAVVVVCVIVVLSVFFRSAFSLMAEDAGLVNRTPVVVDGEKVYYDKKGVAYDDPEDVVLYAKDGTKYVFDGDANSFVGKNNNEYSAFFCYVDSDGLLYYDEDDVLTYGEPENDTLTGFNEEQLMSMTIDDLMSQILGYNSQTVWYDGDGNEYYDAFSASWNEKGELLNAMNTANP